MIGFIIFGFLFSITVGLLIGVILVGGLPEQGEWKKSLIMIIISLVIGFSITAIFRIESKIEEKQWNNGICPTCQKEWKFVNATHIRNEGDIYYYTCEECETIISKHP